MHSVHLIAVVKIYVVAMHRHTVKQQGFVHRADYKVGCVRQGSDTRNVLDWHWRYLVPACNAHLVAQEGTAQDGARVRESLVHREMDN